MYFTRQNTWVVAHADRVSYLIDGNAYFGALAKALSMAEYSVLVLGWDIDTRLHLVRDGAWGYPKPLGRFLNSLVKRKPSLHVDMLLWDYSLIYVGEREFLTPLKLKWATHPRLRYETDDCVPPGGSHHQKVIVIDDSLAFVGGFDLAQERWDTPDHAAGDSRRRNPEGEEYRPFHDIQLMLDGDAAERLGELARDRWARCGLPVPAKTPGRRRLWVPGCTPHFRNASVGISRTMPPYQGHPVVTEVAQLHEDAIRSAKRWIFFENQYLTSSRISDLLSERLQEEDGPEVVILVPRDLPGWLEETTMGVLRCRILKRLRAADRYGKLKVYSPMLPHPAFPSLMLHSKAFVVDDDMLKVGSSNLSNRSMGYDTECDAVIVADGDPELQKGIALFRNRLLAEHLGVSEEEVGEALQAERSLIGAIERLRGGERTLDELDDIVSEAIDMLVPPGAILDPEKPLKAIHLQRLFHQAFGMPDEREAENATVEPEPENTRKKMALSLRVGIIVAVLLAFMAVWQWTPLQAYLTPEKLSHLAEAIRAMPYTPVLAVLLFAGATLIMLPVTVLILVTGILFPTWHAIAYSLAGCVLSAAISYGIGRTIRGERIEHFAGSKLGSIEKWLHGRKFFSVVAVRNMPIAPFAMVNTVAGMLHVHFWHFLAGTFVGMIPGAVALVYLESSIVDLVNNPSTEGVLWALGVVTAIIVGGWGLRRYIRNRSGLRE